MIAVLDEVTGEEVIVLKHAITLLIYYLIVGSAEVLLVFEKLMEPQQLVQPVLFFHELSLKWLYVGHELSFGLAKCVHDLNV